MPNKTSNGKSGGGNSVQWNPTPGHQLSPPTMTFNKGHWAPAPTGSISTFGGMQTFGPEGQLPAMGQAQKGSLSNPVMPAMPVPQAQQAAGPASPAMRQQFESLNPLVQMLFAQRAARRGIGPAMAYENWWNRRHP